jgi:hypothetical protein
MNPPSFRLLNFGVGMTTLVMFMITIAFFWIYVDQTKQTANQMNATLNTILDRQGFRWNTDNVRFNATLAKLNTTYVELKNLVRIHVADRVAAVTRFNEIVDIINNNTIHNLNLTKFNRASLVDTNYVIRKLAEDLNVTVAPFNDPNRPS